VCERKTIRLNKFLLIEAMSSKDHLSRCENEVTDVFAQILAALRRTLKAPATVVGGPTVRPRASPILLLQQLSKQR